MLSDKKRNWQFINLLLASLMLLLIPNLGHTDDMTKELLEAAKSGNVNSLEALISKGADVNSTDSSGNTPLNMAAKFEHIECAKSLLNSGADINLRNFENFSPLMWPAENGNLKMVELFIKNGADLNAKDY